MVSVARRYDVLNLVLFATAGGSGRLRQRLVDRLGLTRGSRVLELGCGTGQVTQRLLAAGAAVTAVDALPSMLQGARRRAPEAVYVVGDALEVVLDGPYDAVVLAFVLHNYDEAGRRALLRRATSVLAPGGTIAVLEWDQPHGLRRAAAWRAVLRRIEPSPSVTQVIDGALHDDLTAAGLGRPREEGLAGGRVRLLLARPASSPRDDE